MFRASGVVLRASSSFMDGGALGPEIPGHVTLRGSKVPQAH